MDELAIRSAWIQAGEDLGIEVVAPARVTVESETIEAIALLPEFGLSRAMVLFGRFDASDADHRAVLKLLQEHGFGFSHLSASYENYDRDLFVGTLNDWGWAANDDAPDWYTGQPWGE